MILEPATVMITNFLTPNLHTQINSHRHTQHKLTQNHIHKNYTELYANSYRLTDAFSEV